MREEKRGLDMRGIHRKVVSFFSGYYNLLLFCLVMLVVFRPDTRSFNYFSTWKILLTGIVVSAIFNCKNPKKVKFLEIALAIPTLLMCWGDLIWTHPVFFVVSG